MVAAALKYVSAGAAALGVLYATLLGLLTTQMFQAHVVYLHAIQMTWFKDLNIPETFGFLHNQVTPFKIAKSGGEALYAWHILPLGLYQKHERTLQSEPSGLTSDVLGRHSFRLLQNDPDARLVIHFHGAGGTVGSGYRCPNYRALSVGDADKIHVLTFDYRGFGLSTGVPTEAGLIFDAISVVEWAMEVAGIAPSRILIYSQSLGTAVNMAVAEHFALQSEPIVFAGHILTAPFVDVATLVSTYSVAGTIPILGPLARFPLVFEYLRSFVRDTWSTKDRIASYVQSNEHAQRPYQITLIHAEDDYDIPWTHTSTLFEHAMNATLEERPASHDIEGIKDKAKIDLGHGGSIVEWKTEHGMIREEILKYGLHDVIMGNPVISAAVMRIFEESQRHSKTSKIIGSE